MPLEARRQLAKGHDPLEQAKLDKIAKSIAAANTFQAVAEEWLEKIEKEGLAAMTQEGALAAGANLLSFGQTPDLRNHCLRTAARPQEDRSVQTL